jgi:hypothetical protein
MSGYEVNPPTSDPSSRMKLANPSERTAKRAVDSQTRSERRLFAYNLRQAMLRAGINFKRLSQRSGVEYSLLRRWGSRGISRIDRRNSVYLEKVADSLGIVSFRQLFEPDFAQTPGPSRTIDRATNPLIADVYRDRPDLFRSYSSADWEELYSLHGTGGALTYQGVLHYAQRINAKRELRRKFEAVLETHHFERLAGLVDELYADTELR